MVNLVVQKEFNGPSLPDIESILDLIDGVVDVRWTNSRNEQAILERNRNRDFCLHVEDLSTMERTATALGLRYVLDLIMNESAKAALVYRKTSNWRAFTDGIGSLVSRSLLTKLSADAIRKGVRPRLASIAADCVLEGISPIDADVLLRLSAMRGD